MSYKMYNGWMFPEYETKLMSVDADGKSVYAGLKNIKQALIFVKKFDTFLDIGANVGLISLPLCERFKNVIAVECVPETYECLSNNLKRYKNATALNFAASDSVGSIEIAIPTSNGKFISSGWASISQDRQKSFQEKVYVTVQAKTIDSLNLENLDFLKIDVEQAEMMVIQGAINTIKKYKPVILFENKRGENLHVLKYLEDLGFRTVPGKKRKAKECILHFSM